MLENENREIKLIGLDMDGTVLKNDKSVSPAVKKAIEDAIAAGIEVVPSTGRSHSNLPAQITEIEGIRYAVVCNGAMIYDIKEDRFLESYSMNREKVLRIIEKVQHLDVALDVQMGRENYTCVKSKEVWVQSGMDSVFLEYVYATRIFVEDIRDTVKNSSEPVHKLFLIILNKEDEAYIKSIVQTEDDLIVLQQDGEGVSVTHCLAHKGNGIVRLGEILGISKEEIMTCGDKGNDLQMIQAAGLGVAMGNAPDYLKQAADYVTKSNEEDGVAYAINKFVLKH